MLYRDLGALAGKVVFAAVNVNQYHAKVSDMMAYSREQRLITVPDRHFLAGPVPILREVWTATASQCRRPARTPTLCTPLPCTSSTRAEGNGSSLFPWPTTPHQVIRRLVPAGGPGCRLGTGHRPARPDPGSLTTGPRAGQAADATRSIASIQARGPVGYGVISRSQPRPFGKIKIIIPNGRG